jgi:hypothetical protein
MKASTKAIRFLETLAIHEGPKAGQLIRLAMTQDKPTAALTARLRTNRAKEPALRPNGHLRRSTAHPALLVEVDFVLAPHRPNCFC